MEGLKVKGLSAGYGKRLVLKDVSLEAFEGRLVSLLGPNGAGKSTLIKCLAGVIKPKKGGIFLKGRDLRKVDLRELSKLVGYVPQNMRPAFSTTVFEAILTSRLPHFTWGPRRADVEKSEEVMKMLGLEELAFRKINELSGGEWQKVLLAMALVKEPEVLLLDEPTSNLDLKHQIEVMKLIKRVTRERRLVTIAALHDANLALRFADEVALMKNGSIYVIGRPEEVLVPENVKEVFGVNATLVKNPRPFMIVEDVAEEVSHGVDNKLG
jgi:iron complex transport system ATP-binding protein